MQSSTQSALVGLVERHLSSLVRESAAVNRRSRRRGFDSAARDDGGGGGDGFGGAGAEGGGRIGSGGGGLVRRGGGGPSHKRPRLLPPARRRRIHHDDVNLALAWRGSEKLYVSAAPGTTAAIAAGGGRGASSAGGDGDGGGGGDGATESGAGGGGGVARLLEATGNGRDGSSPAALAGLPSSIPRVDLNAYLRSELAVHPPDEPGLMLRWLAVNGSAPVGPSDGRPAGNDAPGGTLPSSSPFGRGAAAAAAFLEADDGIDGEGGDVSEAGDASKSSVRIRELRRRLLSEELRLYYARVARYVESSSSDDDDDGTSSAILRGLRADVGLQELAPFLCRLVASGLASRADLLDVERCRRLVRILDAIIDNPNLHLDLHLHQALVPVGTCVVAKNLGVPGMDHWSLREEAAACLAKACRTHGDKYPTMRPRVLGLLARQALRPDRALATQYGGIVGTRLFGSRAVDAFLLPVAREYWERWEEELHRIEWPGDAGKECELGMCQEALLDAVRTFVRDVVPGEQAGRVDVTAFADVFGERLVPMRAEVTEYTAAIV
ncbi:hypothetical protein ACHAWF_005503 [Thalassiosira exigua]